MACLRRSVETVRLLNLLIAVLQVVAGLNGALSLENLLTLHLAPCFISVYAILLALPLFLFECKFKRLQRVLHQQFGFMFHFYGRLAYLIFLAFLDVGIPGGLGFVTAGVIGINLFFMITLRCCGMPMNNVEKQALKHTMIVQDYQAVASSKAFTTIVKVASQLQE
jgi:hypothetical protein